MAKSQKTSLNRDVGVGKIGMNKDAHPTSLDEKAYVHAMNANYEGQDGDLINLQNEESNILCSRFKSGFKVIGYQKDITADRTYFFLTNPTTGQSEIGYIAELETQLSFTDSLKKCGCSVEAVFADGLESIPQVETCTYVTLIADYDCPNGAAGNNCLNFDINYPISSILKDDKGNKILYFTDDLNPRRRLEVDFLDQYYIETEFCSSDVADPDYDSDCDCGTVDRDVCINCDKLKILPEHEPLCIDVEGTVIGGNLRHGQYAFFAGYSDVNGNMMTSYLTATNTVSINDPNKLVYEQPELDALTNFSLKLRVDNLDPSFEYYKVGVMEITSVDGAQSFFSVGVFPTSQKEVLYSGTPNRTQDRIDRAELTRILPEYLKAKIVTATNNTLMFADLEARPDPNLQPVVNFMGQFAKWRTVMAEEDLYEKSFGTSNYRGYMRDEVVPFGIRFLTKDGYRTPVYPLISRLYTNEDRFFDTEHQNAYDANAGTNSLITGIRNADTLENAPGTGAWVKDVYSVLKYGNEECAAEERIFKWQYYNTASQEGGILDSCGEIDPIIINRPVQRTCSASYLTEINPTFPDDLSIRLTFRNGEVIPAFEDDTTCVNGTARFLNFDDYVQNNQDVFEDIANDTTLPIPQRNLAALFVLDNYIDSGPFSLLRPCCGLDSQNDPGFPDSCDDITVTDEQVEVISTATDDPCVNIVYEDCSYYDRPSTSDFCFPFELDPTSGDNKNSNEKDDIAVTGDGTAGGEFLDTFEFFVGKRRNKDDNDAVFSRQQPISGGTDPLAADNLPVDFEEYDSAFSTYMTPLFPDIEIEDENGDTDEDAIAIDKDVNNLADAQANQLVYDDFQAGYGSTSSNEDGGRIKNFKCVNKGDIDFRGYYLIDNNNSALNLNDEGIVKLPQTSNFGSRGRVHKNARWYKIAVTGEDKVYFSLSKASDPDGSKKKRDCLWYPEDVRVSFFETNSGEAVPFFNFDHCNGGSKDHNSARVSIDSTSKGVFELDIEAARNAATNPNGSAFEGTEIYIAIDTPIVRVINKRGQRNSSFYPGVGGGLGDNAHLARNGQNVYYYASPTYCFNVKANKQVIDYVEAFLADTRLNIDKVCFYQANCDLETFEEIKCDPFVRTEGKFSYWESTNSYPNNDYLYNSKTKDDDTNLVVDPNKIPAAIRGEFETIFTTGTASPTEYILSDNADFSCKPIRHFKFPDFAVAPTFGSDDGLYAQPIPFTPAKIFPIGFHIDNDVINAFLDIAVDNNYIDQAFRDSITHYEIFRGDIKLNRSIVAKGMLYDMYKAPEEDEGVVINKNTYFSNFPYNDLSTNKLLFEKSNRKNYISHPFNGRSNNRFTFHSPDVHYERPILPFELYVEADFVGDSRGAFAQVEDHPELTVLSDRAYSVARLLGAAQTTLEYLTNISSALIQVAQSMYLGTVNNYGTGVAWAGFGVYAGTALLNLVPDGRRNVARWVEIFRGQGPRINYAYYYSSVGYLNGAYVPSPTDSLVPYAGDKLRGLKERLYIDNGRYRIDELYEDDPTIINNFNRESSVYLSTGTEKDGSNTTLYSFNIDKDSYVRNYDDSRFSSSQSGCTKASVSAEATASITSPYISLKRFVPNQYNEINDVVWLHTSYCGKLANGNSCDVVFGGDTFLSRFYHKRKFPFFTAPMIVGTQPLGNVPFAYSTVSNIGSPTYYLDYQFDQSDDVTIYGDVPIMRSDFQFDCQTSKRLYMKLPSKFYLYYYGIPGFIVESRINNNFRYGENESDRFFYPGTKDYIG